jgi:hypothetical protein
MGKVWVAALCALSVSVAFAASWISSAKFRHADARPALAWAERAPVSRVQRSANMRVRNGGNAIVEARGSRPKIPPVSLRLAGAFDVFTGPSPTVVVRAGNMVIPATVTGYDFVADLNFIDAKAMVTIEASRPGLRYRALLGSAQLLKQQAAGDGRVDIIENPSLRVSSMTTALDFFIQRELGKRLPVDDDEMDVAARALVSSDVVLANYLLSPGYELPAGYADALALLEERDAYRAHVNADVFYRTNAEGYATNITLAPFTEADLQRNWLMTTRIGRNEVPFSQPTVQLMLRRPGGFAVSTIQSRRNPDFAAELLADGGLRITPEGQAYFDNRVINSQIEPDPTRNPIVERVSVVRETYRRVFVGKRRQLWVQFREEVRSYPQYPSQPTRQTSTIGLQNVSVLEDSVVPVAQGDVLGRRALPYFCLQPSRVAGEPDVLQNCEFALHTLGSNGFGQVDGLGAKVDAALQPAAASGSAGVQWRIDADGALRMDGPQASVRLWRLGIADGASDAMIFLASAQNGSQSLAGHTIALNGNQPVFFGAADPAGTWAYGTFDNFPDEYAYDYGAALTGVRFVRFADGSQNQTSPFAGEAPTSPNFILTQRSGWVLNGLNLYDTRYRANISISQPDTQFFYSCANAFALGATQCAPTRVRYFRPVARVGNRWYGVEDLYTRLSTTSYTPPFQFERVSRANYYDRL